MGKNVLFTRNGTLINWRGLEFSDSTVPPSIIKEAVIEYISGDPAIGVWLNGTTGVNINNNEIRFVATTLSLSAGIALYHSPGILITDNNFIIGNTIHNVSGGMSDVAGIFLRYANANSIENKIRGLPNQLNK